MMIWHDEADRLATWGTLDPTDACMCTDCVLARDPKWGSVEGGITYVGPEKVLTLELRPDGQVVGYRVALDDGHDFRRVLDKMVKKIDEALHARP